jgi:hypothetical protein
MAKTVGVYQLQAQLTKFANKARRETKRRVIVGFSAPYAKAVHEKTEMKLKGIPRPSGIGVYWGPHGEAKYLTNAIRRTKRQVVRRIAQVTKNTHSPTRGMYSGGVIIREAAKARVPVEYGDLRASAYVVVV